MQIMRCMVSKKAYEDNEIVPILPQQIFGEVSVRAQEGMIDSEVEVKGEPYYIMEFNLALDIDLDDIKSGHYEK